MKTSVAVVTVLALGLSFGCGEERASAPAPVPSEPPLAVAAAPVPPATPESVSPGAPDLSIGQGFEMRSAVRDGRLALVPIVATGNVPDTKFITLGEGMRSRQVTIRELAGGWEVDLVRITNRAKEPLFVMSGELIIEAMQDRVLAENKLIQPGETVEVAARCVEQDRDHGGKRFRDGNAIAELALRQAVVHTEQSQVWEQVDAINARLGITAGTKTYRHAAARHTRQPNLERRDRLMQQLAAHPERERMVGLAVAIDGQVIAIDRFTTPGMYRSLEARLLGSYVASELAPPTEGPMLTPAAVRALASMPDGTSTTDASFTALRHP